MKNRFNTVLFLFHDIIVKAEKRILKDEYIEMKKSRIAALVGALLFSLVAFLGLFLIITAWLLTSTKELQTTLSLDGVSPQVMIIALVIAYGLFFILTSLNWVAFAKMEKQPKWARYFLGIGIFYLFASMANGAGLVVTLPVSICFILAYVFKRKEIKEAVSTDTK